MSEASPPAKPDALQAESRGRKWLLAIILLAIVHGIATYTITRTKSATFDEPMHTVAGIVQVTQRDFRAGYDHPPLIHYLAGLAQTGQGISIDTSSPEYHALGDELSAIWALSLRELYTNDSDKGIAIVQRARVPMAIIAALGVLLVGLAARDVISPRAGAFAAALMAVDPNFIGHGSLVKNDVPITVIYIATAWVACRILARITPARVVLLGGLFGLGLLTKFSAFLLIATIAVVLLLRALWPQAWPTRRGQTIDGRLARLGAVLLTALTTATLTYVILWVGYGLSYRASPMLDRIDLPDLITLYASNAETNELPLSTRLIAWMNERQLLPEAFLNGLLFQQATTLNRISYVMGEHHVNGDWYYFPIAMLVKTPVGTLALIGAAMLVAGQRVWHRLASAVPYGPALSDRAWGVILLAAIATAYLLTALRTPLNIGLRHVFPVYPFLFIAAGWVVARGLTRRDWRRWASGALLAATAIESAAATPDQIAFFNRAATAIEPDVWWLGDSNLDWGQDLFGLARWQRDHTDLPLYIGYFGIANPWSHGIKARNLTAGRPFDHPPDLDLGGYRYGPEGTVPDPTRPYYLAISATRLQGQLLPHDPHRELRQTKPLAIIGRSIYIFRIEPGATNTIRSAVNAPSTTQRGPTTR